MKRHKKIALASSVLLFLLFIYYLSELAPYNLQGMLNPNGLGVINQKKITEIEELDHYFKGYHIRNVRYLGSDSYRVTTNKGEFIILVDYSNPSYWRYNVYKYDHNMKHFTNPM